MPQDLQEKVKDVFGDSHEKTMTVSPEMSIDSARYSQEESQDGNDSQNIKTQEYNSVQFARIWHRNITNKSICVPQFLKLL